MPEPDINDSNFNPPTTDRKKFQRRSKARVKPPGEYAEFRLSDGRVLGQVVGPDFFGPPSGSDGGAALPRNVRKLLGERKSTLDGIMRDDPRIAPRPGASPGLMTASVSTAAMSGGDDEGGFLNPLSGPDEREPAGAAMNSSVAGRLPAGIAGGMPGPDRGAPDVDPRAIAGMDDAGLTGLADSRLDFDELTALRPRTYGDSMRYAAAIAKVSGMRKEEVDGLGSLLARDENGMPRGVSEADILPSRARENYERFVTAARARRSIPIDIPLTADGTIDYSLVQPGFLYRGGRGVVLNVGPDRKSFVEAPRRPEKVEAVPTKPENGTRPAAGKVDPRSIAAMDGPWPDVDPRSIAGMDDAGLDVPATRIGKARDTVAALEGVTLPSAVDQVRRDTLKAMVGIHAGEKLPRDYARKARNKAMLDFMAASPALRESMLADQVGLLMDGISDNGKRAVGAYTALKGKMKGIEAMNLPRLYDLKRELEGDVNMGERQRRSFAILIDNEIENSTYRGDTPRAEDAREAARKSKWGPVRLDGERPVDGDAMARLMEDYPGLFDGGGPSGELNGWLLSRDGMVSRVQEAEARLKEVEAKEAKARAAGEHVSDSPLYGSAGAKRALANAKGVLAEQDARILKRARKLGLIHENREGVTWLPGAATPGVDSEPEGVSAIPFDAEGNVDTGRLRVNRYYRRKDDGSIWYWTGKEMVDTRQKLETSDIVVENGEVARDLLVKGETYEVEDGTRFVWDGANFQEVYQNRKSGTWLPLTKAKPLRLFDDNLNIRPADEIEDEARALAQMSGVNVLLVMQIRGDASMLGHAEREIAKAKADAKIYNIPESDYPLLLKWKAKYEEVVNRLVDNQQELMRKSEAALEGRIEALSVEKMVGRQDDPARLENAANSAIQGGGKVFAAIPIFMAVSENRFAMHLNEGFDRIENEGIDNELDFFKMGFSPNSMVEKIVKGYLSGNDEFRARLRKKFRVGDPRKSALYQYGNRLRGYLEEEFEINPRYADEFFATKLPGALGEALTKGVIVGASTIAGVPGPISGAVLGMMTESSGLFLEALENGMPIDEAYKEFAFGALVGMTEGISIAGILGRAATKEADQAIRTALKNAIISGSEDAARKVIVQIRGIVKEHKLADGEEIAAAFSAEATQEFALSLINPAH